MAKENIFLLNFTVCVSGFIPIAVANKLGEWFLKEGRIWGRGVKLGFARQASLTWGPVEESLKTCFYITTALPSWPAKVKLKRFKGWQAPGLPPASTAGPGMSLPPLVPLTTRQRSPVITEGRAQHCRRGIWRESPVGARGPGGSGLLPSGGAALAELAAAGPASLALMVAPRGELVAQVSGARGRAGISGRRLPPSSVWRALLET